MGYGRSPKPLFKGFWSGRRSFREKASETQKGIHALDEAISRSVRQMQSAGLQAGPVPRFRPVRRDQRRPD